MDLKLAKDFLKKHVLNPEELSSFPEDKNLLSLKVAYQKLHPKRNPGRELLDSFKREPLINNDGQFIYVLGAGLGYGIKALLEQKEITQSLLVISSDLPSLILSCENLKGLDQANKRLNFLSKLPSAQILKDYPANKVLAPSLYQKLEFHFFEKAKFRIQSYYSSHDSSFSTEQWLKSWENCEEFFEQSFRKINKEMLG